MTSPLRRVRPVSPAGPATLAPAPVALLAGALLAAAGLGSSCSGNAACVFGPGNCTGAVPGGGGGPGGALGSLASLPLSGQVMLDGAPNATAVFPGDGASTSTPIVIVFSESIAPGSIDGAIAIFESVDLLGQGGLPVIATASLLAEGRVLALLPTLPLTNGSTYEVRLADDAEIRDLSGQLLAATPGELLATFSVADTDPADPRLVTSYPPDGSTGQPTSTELVVVFDRPVSAASITPASLALTVDGAPPAFDPDFTGLEATGGIFGGEDTRVLFGRVFDDDGEAVPFPVGAAIELDVSPLGDEVATDTGETVDNEQRSFTTLGYEAPASVTLQSTPDDAIGVANVTVGSSNELAVRVGLTDAQEGDRVGLFVFGTESNGDGDLIALLREVAVEAGALEEVVFDLEELDIVLGESPLELRFEDGPVALAARVERGLDTSAVTVLDADPFTDGVQDLLLDTVPPELVDLTVPGGGGDLFSSDLRDLVIAGIATEELRAVEVTTTLGGNGVLAPPLGSDATGAFLAAPVPLGAVDPADLPLQYSLALFDRALNLNEVPIEGLFTQVGRVGPDAIVPGAPIDVHVFDAVTLEPIGNAVVATHEDSATFDPVDNGVTTLDGDASVDAAPGGADGTILSVVIDGYDVFTFHGVEASRVDVPLFPAAPPGATTEGVITTADELVSFFLPLLNVRLSDTRRDPSLIGLFPTAVCSAGGGPFGGGELDCQFGPEPIRAGRPGAQSLLAGELELTEITFNAPGVVQVFDLRLPALPAAQGAADVAAFDVAGLLNDPEVPEADVPREIAPTAMDLSLTLGVDLGDLQDDAETTGAPFVTVEAAVPGVAETPAVGMGNAFEQGGNLFTVRAAIPGVVDTAGLLVADGVIDPDLFLRVEVRDNDGNRAGQRPRLSRLDSLPAPFTLFPGSVPQLLAPTPGGSVAGPSYTLTVQDTLISLTGEDGLYRVTLEDETGLRWHLYRPDTPDLAGDLEVHLPDLAAAGFDGLADGDVSCTVALAAWPSFDAGDLFWTDLEREVDTYATGAPVTYTQDPAP